MFSSLFVNAWDWRELYNFQCPFSHRLSYKLIKCY